MRLPNLSFEDGHAAWWLGRAGSPATRVCAVLACALAGALLGGESLIWFDRHQSLDRQTRDVLAGQARFTRADKPAPKPAEPPLSQREVQRHNLTVAQLNVPWSDIFDGLERRSQGDVGLTLLEPDAQKGRLRIQVEAKNVDTLLVYAQRLSLDPIFGTLTLQEHETNDQDPNRPARLSLELRLGGALGNPRFVE